ncbi:MAG TPA: trehalose-phosphatase [Candidatus Cybelea sp.]|nr:trehalose-phosphatase [Candidatus Cybelea sp.]
MTRPPPPLLPLDRLALFLDFDGTLVELAPSPEAVTAPPGLPELLLRLRDRLDCALAIVSGRPVAGIDRMLAPARLAAAGAHGAELRARPDGEIIQIGEPLPSALHAGLLALVGSLRRQWPGLLAEDKGTAFAIHYRQAPEAEPALRTGLRTLPHDEDWEVLAGHCVYEVRSRRRNKGDALHRLMAVAPFAGRQPVYIGDDRTDLDGIAAAYALGGQGVAVGTLDAPAAEWALADPIDVRDWLRRVAG